MTTNVNCRRKCPWTFNGWSRNFVVVCSVVSVSRMCNFFSKCISYWIELEISVELAKITYSFCYSFDCYFLLRVQISYNNFFLEQQNKVSFFQLYLLGVFFITQRQFVVIIRFFFSLNKKTQILMSSFDIFFLGDLCHKESLRFLEAVNFIFKVKKKESDVQTVDKI